MYPWGDFLPISTPLSSHLPLPLNSYFLYTLPFLYSYLPSLKHLSIKSHTVSPSFFAYLVIGLPVSSLYFVTRHHPLRLNLPLQFLRHLRSFSIASSNLSLTSIMSDSLTETCVKLPIVPNIFPSIAP